MALRLPDGTYYEILEIPPGPWPRHGRADGYYHDLQMAVGGVKAWPFNMTARDFKTHEAKGTLVPMLVRQAQALIELYGDVRRPHEFVELMGIPLAQCMAA